jgi:hypothetical protein
MPTYFASSAVLPVLTDKQEMFVFAPVNLDEISPPVPVEGQIWPRGNWE